MTAQLRAADDGVIGKLLLGRYRVVRELAKGGMGVVYLARAEGAVGFVKPVVIKLLLPEHAQDDRYVRMFVREAQILSQLRHPSLAGVLDFGEQQGAYVLVLEYVRGYHVGQWLRYLAAEKRAAPAEILVQIIVDVLDALHHAHSQVHPDGEPMQIVHRDVSPSNILLDEDGRARLLDFGVARIRGGTQDFKTQVDGVVGKLPYTAPELFDGGDASPRSDLYACGVVLHEALMGRNVFRAEMQAATFQRVMNHVPQALEGTRPDVPAGLDAVLAKALSKSAAARYEDARGFATALRRLQRDQESEIRSRLANLLRVDFGPEMAELLNLESLADRDEAWRRLSAGPGRTAPNTRMSERPPSFTSRQQETAPLGPVGSPSVPPAMGATVANSPLSRSATRQPRSSQPPAPEPEQPRDSHAAAKQLRDADDAEPADRAPRPAPPSAASRSSIVAGAITVVCAALAAATFWMRPPPATPARAPAPAIRVVALPIEPETQVAPEAPAPVQPVAATPPPTRKDSHAKHAAPDPRELTVAFRKQQPKLENCFKQHSGPSQAHPSAEIEFDLDANGKLTRVQLAPRALASSPLGECLLQVARKTAFPNQGRAVTFAIPLSARGAAAAANP